LLSQSEGGKKAFVCPDTCHIITNLLLCENFDAACSKRAMAIEMEKT